MMDSKVYDSKNQIDSSYKQLLRARNIKRYSVEWQGDWMEFGFTREIIGSLNVFAEHIGTISIWDMVIDKYNEEDQFELRHEFMQLPMYFCLNQPKAIKDRIIYCATHLCHQANLAMNDKKYNDDLPSDYKIGLKELQKRISKWESGKELISALSKLSSTEFKQATRNYRDMAHHRIPPALEYGLTNFVTRMGYRENSIEYITIENGISAKKRLLTKGISYAFGGTEPLKSTEMLPILKSEHENARNAFYAYWQMMAEHGRVNARARFSHNSAEDNSPIPS